MKIKLLNAKRWLRAT